MYNQERNTDFLEHRIYFFKISGIIKSGEVISLKYKIGERIKKLRESRGLSQRQLAEALNISNSRVSNWEQGINRPDADMLGDLCRALHVSPSELLDVYLSEDDFTAKEREIIYAYRKRPELQHAVNILLGIEEKKD